MSKAYVATCVGVILIAVLIGVAAHLGELRRYGERIDLFWKRGGATQISKSYDLFQLNKIQLIKVKPHGAYVDFHGVLLLKDNKHQLFVSRGRTHLGYMFWDWKKVGAFDE